jgi:autotransporter-associated beta strand protein
MHLNVSSHRLTRIAGKLVSVATGALNGSLKIGACALALGLAHGAHAGEVLIVNYGLVATIDTNLQARQIALGNNATIVTLGALPTNLAQYGQIWDLGANQGIGTGYASSLTSYLQGGGTLFMMGENAGYGATRNAAMTSFMASLGAGSVTVSGNSPASQTVLPQFQADNSTSTVSFAAVGAFNNYGTGTCITSGCGAVAWGVGSLANATLGAVISVLDVNFLQTQYLQAPFTDNLISYLAQQQVIAANGGVPTVPDIGTGAASYDASGLGTLVNPAFKGGTLNIDAPVALGQGFTLGSAGGRVQANGTAATFSGVISDEVTGTPGALGIVGTGGAVTLSGANTFTGATTVGSGATLALSGTGSVAASSGVAANGTLDIAGTTAGASITSLSGNGVVVLGSQTLTLTGASGNFAGVLSGSGGLALAHGTQTLSGGNAYTGTTQVDSGATLALAGSGSVAASAGIVNAGTLDIAGTTNGATLTALSGAGNVVLGAQTLTLTHAAGGFTGALSGTGGLTISGGTLTLTGVQGYTGMTTLGNGAALSVNGLMAGGVAVQSGGVLHGSGGIAGPVTVAAGATLSPGNSPGVMTTGSSVTLAPGAVFEVEINGATAGNGAGFHDQLNVLGIGSQFNANGATLAVNLTTISGIGVYTPYVPTMGQSFRVVTAEGGLGSTRFAPIAQPDGLAFGTRLRVFYDDNASNSIDLRVVPASLTLYGVNRNAQSAASAVDRMMDADDAGTATPAQNQLVNTIGGLGAAQLNGALLGLSGEIHGALAAAQPLAGQGLQSAVTNHLASSQPAGAEQRTGWVDYSAGDVRWSNDGVSSAASAQRTQLTLGADLWQTPRSRIGVAGSTTTAHVDSAGGGSGKLEDNLAVVYAQHTLNGWTGDAQIGFGGGNSHSDRADPLASQNAAVYSQRALATDLSTRQSFAGVGVRLPMQWASVAFEPFVRFSAQQVKREAGAEDSSSPSALHLDTLSAHGQRVTGGVSLQSAQKNPMVASTTYQGTLAIGHDAGSLLRPVVSATLGGMATTIEAPQAGRAFVQANVFGTRLLARRSYAYAGLSGEARSKRVEQTFRVGAVIGF